MPRALIKKRPHPVKGRSLIRCTTCYIIRACVRIPASSAVFLCSVLWRGLLFHVCSWRTILCICRYMFPVTEEIRQFLLNDHLYIRYSSGYCRTTSELKLRSDIPPYLLVPGSHHPRFAASFPYGLLSPSQLFSIYAVYYRLGKIHMSSVFRDFFLLYVCSLLLNGIFTDCK